jgi:hypothetical protein
MPRQLIYTSVPRGLTPGQSGYCTVARSRDLREALIPHIEKLSYYTPESNQNPIVCAHRILDVRGTKFHILTRIVDAGLDFTKRRSFLAHHLIFEPHEIATSATPAEIFLHWKGWLQQWHGDPQWLEDNRPLPARSHHTAAFPKSDLWITGDDSDRKNFLPTLIDRGVDWEMTFTNCFQPGDHADDFNLKAAWPKTPGYESSKSLDANFIRLGELPRPKLSVADSTTPAATPEVIATPPVAPSTRRDPSLNPVLSFSAVTVTIIAFIATLYLRHRAPQNPPTTLAPVPLVAAENPVPEISSNLNILLPARPTWLAIAGRPSRISRAEELMVELRANEVFTKDLTASFQPDLHQPAISSRLFAEPEHNLLRFTATNYPPIDLTLSGAAHFQTALTNSFAVEIPGRFRILAIKTPVPLSRDFLDIKTNIELHADFKQRIHRVELPTGSQLALRPLVLTKGGWIDPLADLERDFALIPSTILDLPAVQTHARQVIADKDSKLRAFEQESAPLAEAQKKVLTDPTPEQAKAKDRLAALQLAISKARQELDSLRAKATAIPLDPSRIDRFALFLCLSNVNTEIFRFSDSP